MRVAILGAGISGLSLAEALHQNDPNVEVVVFEESHRAGGKIKTHKSENLIQEEGPHGFLNNEPHMEKMIDDVGLRNRVIIANPNIKTRYLIHQGQRLAVPSSPPALLKSPLLSFSGKLRALLGEVFVQRRTASSPETIYAFLKRRFGFEVANRFADILVTGIYAGDPHKLTVQSAFPSLAQLEQDHRSLIKSMVQKKFRVGKLQSFDQGMEVLTQTLAARTKLRTEQVVHRIQKTRDGFEVTASSETSEFFDRVVVTLPSHKIVPLFHSFLGTATKTIRDIHYASITVVNSHGTNSALPHGFGLLAPQKESPHMLGIIFASEVFQEHVPNASVWSTRTLFGGTRSPNFNQNSDEMIQEETNNVLQLWVMNKAAHAAHQIVRWDEAIPQYDNQQIAARQAVDDIQAQNPGLYFLGSTFRGVAVNACVRTAFETAPKILYGASL